MTSRDFCFWLQGFFELDGGGGSGLTAGQTAAVKRHLALVFKHEIDPSMGAEEHQDELNEIHEGPCSPPLHDKPQFRPHGDLLIRC
jgi:hypothetical protein